MEDRTRTTPRVQREDYKGERLAIRFEKLAGAVLRASTDSAFVSPRLE